VGYLQWYDATPGKKYPTGPLKPTEVKYNAIFDDADGIPRRTRA